MKRCLRCNGHIPRRHLSHCTYLGTRRVVSVEMHEDGMVYTHANGRRAVCTAKGLWLNLTYFERHPEHARKLGIDVSRYAAKEQGYG